MDADQIRSLEPELRKYLGRFDDCFKRSDTRGHLPIYVEGQLSDLPRKSCEPIADAHGSAAYKRVLVRVHVERALREACGLPPEEGPA